MLKKRNLSNKIFSFLLLISLVITLIPVFAAAETPQIKNIIYMIPDGGGYSPYDFANMVKKAGGFDKTKYPLKTPTDTTDMALREYLAGSMSTFSLSGGVTDSAAAGTAMATGRKTYNGRLGVNSTGNPIANLVEAAQSVGKATGLISTYEWMHATPGAFSAHVMSRNDYLNIYQQMENKGMEVVLGAGYGAVSDYATIQNAVDRGYTVINNKKELENVKPGDKIWGNIVDKSFPYDIELSPGQATLAEMTAAAITALSGDEDGFFLMVEGSKVDSGGHANDAVITTSEFLAFDAAFKVALDFAKGRTDTIIVCAPDHDTGGMILKADMKNEVSQVQKGTNPSTISWSSTNHTGQNVGVWMYVPEGVAVIPGLNETTGDTAQTRKDYIIDNTAIAPYCAKLMGVDLKKLTKELFVDITNLGKYTKSNGKFVFNNGDKYVYRNNSVYYKDGREISMNNKQVVVIDGKVFAPAEIIDEDDWNYQSVDTSEGITGSGSIQDPYVINSEDDFIEFTEKMIGGEKYTGKYIVQETDLNLVDCSAYTGIGKSYTFAGTYNGKGHTINIALKSSADSCLFPYTTGTIYNLGVTGTVKNKTYAGAICRSLREGGKLVNCWSTAEVSADALGGLVWSNYGMIENCFFGGKVSGTNVFAVASPEGTAYSFKNVYYLVSCGKDQFGDGIINTSDKFAKTNLASKLNEGRKDAAKTLGVGIDDVVSWTNQNGFAELYIPRPIVKNVKVTPGTAKVKTGEGLQFKATVTGENNFSSEVIWSIEGAVNEDTVITEEGYLKVSSYETASSFTVMAKSKQDGSISGISKVTVEKVAVTEPQKPTSGLAKILKSKLSKGIFKTESNQFMLINAAEFLAKK